MRWMSRLAVVALCVSAVFGCSKSRKAQTADQPRLETTQPLHQGKKELPAPPAPPVAPPSTPK